MKDKKAIIFILLLLIWGVLFVITSNSKKGSSTSTISENSKRESKQSQSEKASSTININKFLIKHNLKLNKSHDIFFGSSYNKSQQPEIPKQTLKVIEKKPVEVKNIAVSKNATQLVVTPVPIIIAPEPVQPVSIITPPPLPVVAESTKIMSLIDKIEISGLYKQGKTITIFLMYDHSWYEFKNEGIIKMSTDTSSYDVVIKAINDSYVLIKQDSLQISLKKRIRGE